MPLDRRTDVRWPYLDIVSYRSVSATGEGQLTNASETGVFVCTDRCPLAGESVQILLKGTTPVLDLSAIVRRTGSRADGAKGFGAELLDPPDLYLQLIRSISVRSISVKRQPGGKEPQRVAPRIAVSVPVDVELGTTWNGGILSDISLSGARVERTGIRPSIGSLVSLVFALDGKLGCEVMARVVRETSTGGYAVQFEECDSAFKAALERATGLVRKPSDRDG